MNPLDNPLYYLVNFRYVLAWLAEHYSDVLGASEQRFIEQFTALPEPSQALLVRLVMRKGPLYRESKLAYLEIGAIGAAAQPLLALGWLCAGTPLSLAELFSVLDKTEVLRSFPGHGLRASQRKDALFEQLAGHYPEPRPFTEWCPGLGALYQLALRPLCERLRLMFFGNLYQDWSQFVLADLGVQRFEQVAFAPGSRALACREDVDAALAVHAAREALELGEAVGALLARLAAIHTANPWLQGRRAKLAYLLAYHCERLGHWAEAEGLYRECAYPGARWRLLRVYEQQGRHAEAWALWQQAWAAPESPAEAQALPRALPRLQRALGLPVAPRRRAPGPARLDLCLPQASSVEAAVCQALAEEGAPVLYLENALFNSLFGLLCWPAIFAPVPGAFFHPFQHAPADLHQADFYSRRQALFEACLGELDSGSYQATILARFASKYGLASPFVFWGALSEPLLALALACIPPAHLKLLFARLLEDLKSNRAGLPDLVQFWPAEGRYRMIEVKGPGDRLQDNQLRWMAYFAEHGLPVQVCYVSWHAEVPA
ncbi:VRR-NUC domain-containing protein [Pseudomonas sp. NPDC007930]|uniref:VRR-NUC domain-containing protein n=1 Tax=Pseudomonas sp. NPDC007930 TaxID=3364417 RepID=UPI0036ED03F3